MTIYKHVSQLAQDKGYKPHYLPTFLTLDTESKDYVEIFTLLQLTLIQKWLRDEHKLHITVEFDRLREEKDDTDFATYSFRINEQWSLGKEWIEYSYGFKHITVEYDIPTYEQALLEGIYETLKLLQ